MLGLSAQSIAHANGANYPHDPADLLRCIDYCRGTYDTDALRQRMAGKSPEWDRLLAHWDELAELLANEMGTRSDWSAPLTYMAMKRILADGVACTDCNSTGRGTECPKCRGTGSRSGGRCRADRCYRGAAYCPTCHGRGYTKAGQSCP